MTSKEKKQMQASYFLKRIKMVKELSLYINSLEEIAFNGINSDEDERLAKIACSIMASDYHYENSLLEDKTGDSYKPLIDPPPFD